MKVTMDENSKQQNWLRAIKEAAKEQLIELPQFTQQAMGVAHTVPVQNGRFVTVKYRLVPRTEALHDGIQWTLWQREDDLPDPELSFRRPLKPEQEAVNSMLRVLKGWLLDNWTLEETKAAIRKAAPIEPLQA
jgi:hypothetical protein